MQAPIATTSASWPELRDGSRPARRRRIAQAPLPASTTTPRCASTCHQAISRRRSSHGVSGRTVTLLSPRGGLISSDLPVGPYAVASCGATVPPHAAISTTAPPAATTRDNAVRIVLTGTGHSTFVEITALSTLDDSDRAENHSTSSIRGSPGSRSSHTPATSRRRCTRGRIREAPSSRPSRPPRR